MLFSHSLKLPIQTYTSISKERNPKGAIFQIIQDWSKQGGPKYLPYVLKISKLDTKAVNILFDFTKENYLLAEHLLEEARKYKTKLSPLLQYILVKHYNPELIAVIDENAG